MSVPRPGTAMRGAVCFLAARPKQASLHRGVGGEVELLPRQKEPRCSPAGGGRAGRLGHLRRPSPQQRMGLAELDSHRLRLPGSRRERMTRPIDVNRVR